MKVLSFLLAAAMVSAAAVMPVSVSAEENAGGVLICEENFDEITSLADLKGDAASKTGWGYNAGSGNQYGNLENSGHIDLIEGEDGNKYLYTYRTASHPGNENTLYYDATAITEGRLVAEYDIKFDRDNYVNMRIGYGNRSDNMVTDTGAVYNAYWRDDNKQQLAADNTINADTWYHVTMTADFDNGTMELVMVDPDGVKVVNKLIEGFTAANETRWGINTVSYAKNGSDKQGAYLDNVKITHIPPAGPATLPMNETFDYDNVYEMANAGWWFEGASNNVSKIDSERFMLGLSKDANPDNQQAKRLFTPVTSGAVSMEWDVVPSEYTNAVVKLWGSQPNTSVFPVYFHDDNKIYVSKTDGSGEPIGEYTPGMKYHCEVVADMDNKTIAATVKNESNEIIAEGNFTHTAGEIKEITLQTWLNNDFASGDTEVSYVTFDNLEIKQIPSVSAPVWADGTINADDSYHATTATFTVKPNGVTNFGVEVNVGEQSQTKRIENVESEIKFGIILISDDENNLVTDNVTAGIAD